MNKAIQKSDYIFKANNRNSCVICSKFTIETTEQLQQRCSGVFIVTIAWTMKHLKDKTMEHLKFLL